MQLAIHGAGRRLRFKFNDRAGRDHLILGHKRGEDLVGDGAKSGLLLRLCGGRRRPHRSFDLPECGASRKEQASKEGKRTPAEFRSETWVSSHNFFFSLTL
jgi:hypothetical protein